MRIQWVKARFTPPPRQKKPKTSKIGFLKLENKKLNIDKFCSEKSKKVNFYRNITLKQTRCRILVNVML